MKQYDILKQHTRTHRYDRGQGNKEGKIRVPAWCDRVLWRKTARAHALVRQLHYDRETYMMSDHMPVVAVFEVGVKNRLDDERVARRKRMNGALDDSKATEVPLDRKPSSPQITTPLPRRGRGQFRSNSKVMEEIASVTSSTIYFNIQVARKSQDMKRFLKSQSAIHCMLNRLDLLFLRHGIANMCRIVPLPLVRLDSDVSYSGTETSEEAGVGDISDAATFLRRTNRRMEHQTAIITLVRGLASLIVAVQVLGVQFQRT